MVRPFASPKQLKEIAFEEPGVIQKELVRHLPVGSASPASSKSGT